MRVRLVNRTVAEILNAVPGFTVEQCFHPDIIAASVVAPIAVEPGWVIEEDGTIKDAEGAVQYTPPEPEPQPEPEPEAQPDTETPTAEVVADDAPEAPTEGA